MVRRIARSNHLLRRNIGLASLAIIIIFPYALKCHDNVLLREDYLKMINESTGIGAKVNFINDALTVDEAYDDSCQLSKNIEVIKLIRNNEVFQQQTYEKKCHIVKALVACEARFLGLCKINIIFDENLDDQLLGSYCHKTKTITVNSKVLKNGSLPGGDSHEVMLTVLEECRHCYQYLLAETYISLTPEQRNLMAFKQKKKKKWIENMTNYKKGVGNINQYISYQIQPLEQDAKLYAIANAEEYYKEIDQLLKKEN